MPTLREYAHMASAVYGNDKDEVRQKWANCPTHGAYNIIDYQGGIAYANDQTAGAGFQGAIFASADDVVMAYKGSKGGAGSLFGGASSKQGTGYDDWHVNDVQIMLNRLPSQVPNAENFTRPYKQLAEMLGARFSMVGHSLGGGLAQYIGWLWGVPFVTFNAPGMAGNLVSGRKSMKSAGKVPGFNMILATDPVGNFGVHLGKTERFLALGKPGMAHKMTAVLYAVEGRPTWAARDLAQLV